MEGRAFQAGDWVVYRRTKHSEVPGPRAHDVSPFPGGDMYSYVVDKFWVVLEVESDGGLLLRTPGGKEHRTKGDDPNLRRPTWWERLRYGNRFRSAEHADAVAT